MRLICVNDVYELDLLANLATCRREMSTPNTLTLVAGDFIAPSLLTSLDKGRGMVDTLNKVGVDYVCIGNHECDVPHAELLRRVAESKFTWINTNMRDLPLHAAPNGVARRMPEFAAVEVLGGGQLRRVALLGLNTEDPRLYVDQAWGGVGAACVKPVVQTAKHCQAKLLEQGFDVVIPLTHQEMLLDRAMAHDMAGLPLIVGGHDHEPYCEEVRGTRIVKAGCNARQIAIVDIAWANAKTPGVQPVVRVNMRDAKDFAPDPSLRASIGEHLRILEALNIAELCPTPRNIILSSKEVRRSQASMGTLIASLLRDALHADCACMNAGAIRGDTTYPASKRALTYNDLKKEIPYDAEVVSVLLPGGLITEMVAYSRMFAAMDPPPRKLPGCFMQLDDQMVWDDDARVVTHIGGQPLQLERSYHCVVLFHALGGLDDIRPLVDYGRAHARDIPHSVDSARPAKDVIVDYFSKAMWWDLLKRSGQTGDGRSVMRKLDTSGDGYIDIKELQAAMHQLYGEDVSHLVIDNIFAVVDSNADHRISAAEMLRACVVSRGGRDELSRFTFEDLRELAVSILGDLYDEEEARALFAELDTERKGTVTSGEMKRYMERDSNIAPVSLNPLEPATARGSRGESAWDAAPGGNHENANATALPAAERGPPRCSSASPKGAPENEEEALAAAVVGMGMDIHSWSLEMDIPSQARADLLQLLIERLAPCARLAPDLRGLHDGLVTVAAEAAAAHAACGTALGSPRTPRRAAPDRPQPTAAGLEQPSSTLAATLRDLGKEVHEWSLNRGIPAERREQLRRVLIKKVSPYARDDPALVGLCAGLGAVTEAAGVALLTFPEQVC